MSKIWWKTFCGKSGLGQIGGIQGDLWAGQSVGMWRQLDDSSRRRKEMTIEKGHVHWKQTIARTKEMTVGKRGNDNCWKETNINDPPEKNQHCEIHDNGDAQILKFQAQEIKHWHCEMKKVVFFFCSNGKATNGRSSLIKSCLSQHQLVSCSELTKELYYSSFAHKQCQCFIT